jgi:hypothetical protein
MIVCVNDETVRIFPGMTVRHVLIKAGLISGIESGQKVLDEWGNEIGLDGSVEEGMKIYVR